MPILPARRSFTEMADLETLIENFGSNARVRTVAEVHDGDKTYPLYSVAIGSTDPKAPSLGIFAGAHGLEKIGSEVVLSHMHTLLEMLRWDKSFRDRLKVSRLVFMPLVNPAGVVNRTRSNARGVDIIRKSPLDGEGSPGPFYRGHRLSSKLPYYRGELGAEMEVETKALIEVLETEILTSTVSITLDVHSGFGARDRFWFPYSHTRKPFPYLAEAYALKGMLDGTYSNHFYVFEPMSRQYTIHGDPWDYVFEENRKKSGHGLFMPFCLEMGSWTWLRKNPLQVFSKSGMFDPMKPHRRRRILRRHLTLFDFLHRALLSPEAWVNQSDVERKKNLSRAMELWYADE